MEGFKGPVESLLRPIYEFEVVAISALAIFALIYFNTIFLLSQQTALGLSFTILLLAVWRFLQGYKIYKYQKNLVKLPFYSITPEQIPSSRKSLFLGKGFLWTQKHTQRLSDLKHDKYQKYRDPPKTFQLVRRLEQQYPNFTFFDHQKFWNPYKPLPLVGGNPTIHAIGMFEGEHNVALPVKEREGHLCVFGSTGVGKTRLADTLVTQDIQNNDTVIFIDPKGDADIMLNMYIECKKLGRPIYIFHLGYPEISCRYNAIGSFTKITEVAGRISDQLPSDGNSAVFKDFAWGFINIVAMAMVKCKVIPNFTKVSEYINNIDPLIKLYKKEVIDLNYPDIDNKLKELKDRYLRKENKTTGEVYYVLPPKEKDETCFLISKWQEDYNIVDQELSSILIVFKYDSAYYSKLVASLRPLLDKLTSGEVAKLLSPDNNDKDDKRPIINFEQIIRQNAVVYIGLDALSDNAVSHAVGAAMFADLTSLAGKFYKHGREHGLPNIPEAYKDKYKIPDNQDIIIHADEFNEVIGEQFIPMINKARGAGFRVTAYTQSFFDLEAGIGDKAKANVIFDNFNNVIFMRVKSKETAEKFLEQLGEVEVNQLSIMSQTNDSSKINDDINFSSATREQIGALKVSTLTTEDLIRLPKGQAFCIINGGQLYKIRIPQPKPSKDKGKTVDLPDSLVQMHEQMRQKYHGEINYDRLYEPIVKK